MAEPLQELCPHCGTHFRPREGILQQIAQLKAELKDAEGLIKAAEAAVKDLDAWLTDALRALGVKTVFEIPQDTDVSRKPSSGSFKPSKG